MTTSQLPLLLLVALGYNVAVALVYGYDKWQAKRGGRRVPERTLMGLTATFGGLGALAGMRTFRHKTLKPRFRFGVPLLLALQVVVASALIYAAIAADTSLLPASVRALLR